MPEPSPHPTAAVLVGVQLPGVSDAEHASDLAELGRLARTLGFEIAGTVSQRREYMAAAAVLGEGKLKELAELTGGKGTVPTGAKPKLTKARARFRAGERASDANADVARSVSPAENVSRARSTDEDRADEDRADEGRADRAGTSEKIGDPEDDRRAEPTMVLVDHEISPSQARNLERATGATVLDRTGVIVEIFHRHARSREARLQVEIARLTYVAPRLRESASSERQHGRGAGESALELDRRKIRDRISELRKELESIRKQQDNRRQGRREQPRVALVGYTNAGKSSLMRALTGSEVLVEDKLFATLDTTVRSLEPATKPRILVSDTVGFIKKLPHDLVASFRSTLDEALEASLLLHVVDASDPTFESQMEVTRSVLAEIGAHDVPTRVVLNKADRLPAEERRTLPMTHPDALVLSAHDPHDIDTLRSEIVAFFDQQMVVDELVIPYARQALAAEVYETSSVLSQRYDENGSCLRVRAWPATLARLRRALDGG